MARNNSDIDDLIYRHYVANSLRLIPEGKQLTMTLDEILNPKPADNRSGADIVLDVMEKAGLTFGE